MFTVGSKKISIAAACVLALPWLVSGCGSTQKSSFSSSGGSAAERNPNEYRAQDAQLIERSNSVAVYSSPEKAKRAIGRQPDNVVDEGNGVETHYYNADSMPTSERLRLRYSGGRLIGKEIVPPDANGDVAKSKASKSNIPASDSANYIDMREYNPKSPNANNSRLNKPAVANPSDNVNAPAGR